MTPPVLELSVLTAAGATFAGVPVAAVRVVLANGAVVRLRLPSVAGAELTGRPAVERLGSDDRQRPFRPSPCGRDVLAVLSEASAPLVITEIRAKLEANDQIHGESTLKKALAAMVRAGVLVNPGHRVGYSVGSPPRLA